MRLVTKAVVLRETAYKESDKILTVLTQERGRLTVSARASRKKGGGVSAVSQLLVWSEMTLSERNHRWTLSEGETEQEFRRVRSDLERLALGSYLAELTELLTDEGIPDEGMYELLLAALFTLERTDQPLPLVKAAFELSALRQTGYCPQLARCAVCGGEPQEPCFVPAQGVVCCARCAKQLGALTLPLDAGALAAARYVVGSAPRRAFSFRLGAASLSRLSRAMERFLQEQLERSFATLDYYHQVTNARPATPGPSAEGDPPAEDAPGQRM